MKLEGKLTAADVKDAGKLTRSKMYWVKLVIGNLYGMAIIFAIAFVTISGALGYTKPNWAAIAVAWLVIGGVVTWIVYSAKRSKVKQMAKLNAALPEQISLTSEGIKLEGPNGATGFQPWKNFKGWREGRRIVLVDGTQANLSVLLPVSQLSEIERQSLRQLLQSSIPPAS